MNKEIIKVSIDILKVHPRNSEFFDDIQGKEYEQFKESIKNDGLLTPILVSPDMTVISGHQRLKACKELGVVLVPVMIREDLTDENEKLKLLLAANFGRIKNDDAKQRKIAVEYVNLCGYRNGEAGGGHQVVDNRLPATEIAKQLGVSETTLKEILSIERKLTPEMKELLDKDKLFSKTTAAKIISKLSSSEQEQLISALPVTERLTQKQVQNYVDKLKETQSQMNTYKTKAEKSNELQSRITKLESEIKELEQRKPVLQVKEVVPDDYNVIKSDNITLASDNESLRSDNARMVKEYKAKCKELFDLKDKLKAIEEDSAKNKIENELKSDCIFFCARCDDFIKKVGGYAYLSDKLGDLPEKERKSYLKCVQMISAWAENIITNIDTEHN